MEAVYLVQRGHKALLEGQLGVFEISLGNTHVPFYTIPVKEGELIQGKFVIGDIKPGLWGGAFMYIVFFDHPDKTLI